MATGTRAGLLDAPRPQSVYKHALLERYMIQFATMTSKPLSPRRSTLVDAFAGRGRHDDGTPASGEQMMLAAQKAAGQKDPVAISIFLVEQSRRDFVTLDSVADEYRATGLDIVTRHGSCADHLDEIDQKALGSSLFMFIDPCGALLPWTTLQPLLARRGTWPRTEALLNFNADFTRRACGQLRKNQLDLGGVAALDTVCGGTWWRDVAMDALIESGGVGFEAPANAVSHEYARRLAESTGMRFSVSAVRRNIHLQPVYHLVFLTPNETGLWVMNNAAAVARQLWLHELGPDEDAETGMLFPMFTVEEQIAREKVEAVARIEENLVLVVADGSPKEVVRHTTEVFDGVYGIAKETYFSEAVRNLVKGGRLAYHTKASRPRSHVLVTPPGAGSS